MASKLMKSRESQKALWEVKLSQRLEILKNKGVSEKEVNKDTVVRKIKSKIKDTAARIRAIAAKEEKIKEMARIREEKKAAPVVKEKGKKAVEEAPAAKKEKKAKGEKAPKEPKAEKAPKEPKAEKDPKPKKEPKPKEPKAEPEAAMAEPEAGGSES